MPSSSCVRLLYSVDHFPIFQNRVYDHPSEAIACPKGNIRLVQSSETGLIFNEAFNPEIMTYDASYQNEQSLSPSFRRHLDQVSNIVRNALGFDHLIEVGCGKGFFLEMLQEQGFNIIGFDPTYEGDNPSIEKKFFSSDMSLRGHGIILRHVLEHIPNPIQFLFQLKEANQGRGRIYIEVPCLDWICENKAWFDIFYEHVNYFRLADFYRLFDEIISVGKLFGDQYIYVVAELSSLKNPTSYCNEIFEFPKNFLDTAENYGRIKHPKRAIWGGGSKGVIFSLFMERLGSPIDFIFDINPAKQEKYIPYTGLQVLKPQAIFDLLPQGSPLLVMNSNYMDEIKQMSIHLYTYLGIDHARS